MITQEEFDRRLAVSVAAGKVTQEIADRESERRRRWLAGQPPGVAIARAPRPGPGPERNPLDEARAGVVKDDGDQITVDDNHPTHYRQPKARADLPSFVQKLKNFTKSAANHVASGMPMCTAEQVAERFAICQGCEFYKDGACLKCGCPLVREKKFISKLSWANESCPVGKWGKVDTGS